MIHVTEVIQRLRDKLPSWRIDGAAEYAAAEDKSRLLMPAMYVMLGRMSYKTLSYSTYLQEYDERFVILLGVNNIQDRTGKYAQDFVLNARLALHTCLVNYRIDPDAHAIVAIDDDMVSMDKARYWHKFEFSIVGRIGTEDVTPLVLEDFDRAYADWNLVESNEEDHPDAQDHIDNIF